MKAIIILMAVMFCSFSAYSHLILNDNIIHYREVDEKRFDEDIYSSITAYREKGFFTDSYYIHYHIHKRNRRSLAFGWDIDITHNNGEYTFEISRDDYERIIYTKDYMSFPLSPTYFNNRVIFY